MIAYDELLLSDGTTTVDLLSWATRTGAHLTAWRASSSRYKDGGTWHNSATAPGRRPAMHLWDAVEERMTFNVVGWTPDDRERYTSGIRNILQAAWDYSAANLPQSSPVYLIRRVHHETNREYCLVLGGFTNEDVDYSGTQTEYGISAFNDWAVTIWREEHWRDVIPGDDPTCVLNSGYGRTIQHIEFDPDTLTHIQIPAGAGLNNLPQGTITVEAWIRIPLIPNVPGELTIASKCAVGPLNGWVFWWDATNGLNVQITAPGNDAWTHSTIAAFAADNVWHHVAFTFDDAVDNWVHLWVDGLDRALFTQNKGAGVDADAASDMYIGAVAGTNNFFRGDIGWVRVSNTILYPIAFPATIPPRCYLPDITAITTIGQWIGGEVNGATIDNQDGAAGFDGTLTGGIHLCDCLRGTIDVNGDPEYLCDEDDVTTFIRNAHVRAQPTHMYALDQPAAYGADLVESSAFNILPPNSVAGDGFYVGVTAEATLFYGPFFNLVFDIASAGTYTGVWQYYSTVAGPAWANLDVHDGTGGLENTGIVAVTWELPAANDWEPLAINGFTGYWVRFHLTAGHANPPVQQNRPVYTTTWAFTEFEDTSTPGDVPALAQYQCILAGEGELAYEDMDGHIAARFLFGLRSLSRGPDFCAYLNAGNTSVVGAVGAQEPIGVVPDSADDAGTGISTVDDVREQGLHVLCDGGADTWYPAQSWDIQPAYAWQYYGRFRLFVRADASILTGTAKIRAEIHTYGKYYTTREYAFLNTDPDKLVDLGLVMLPGYAPVSSADTPWESLSIQLETCFSNDTDRIRLYGIVLLPADEKVVEVTAIPPLGLYEGLQPDSSTRLLIDSTQTLRTGSIRSLLTDVAGDIVGYELPISAGPATFQANANQRVWMVVERYDGTNEYWFSPQVFHAKMLLHRVARYRSTRGGR